MQTSKLDIYNVVIQSNGLINWIPTAHAEVDCAGDEKILTIDDPSEPQECHIKMGSWTYDANHINITTDNQFQTTHPTAATRLDEAYNRLRPHLPDDFDPPTWTALAEHPKRYTQRGLTNTTYQSIYQ